MKLPANQTRYAFIDSEMRLLNRNEINAHHCAWERAETSQNTRIADESWRLASNFTLQQAFIRKGMVTPL
jgi:hypothetical protein